MLNKKYLKSFMKTAQVWAEESYCKKGKVGCVIVDTDRIISHGFNGTISGDKNKCEDIKILCPDCKSERIYHIDLPIDINTTSDIYKCDDCKTIFKDPVIEYKTDHTRVIHAEANAIYFAAKRGINLEGTSLVVTKAPCINCANIILSVGIKEVFYLEDYKNDLGIQLLKKFIKVEKYEF